MKEYQNQISKIRIFECGNPQKHHITTGFHKVLCYREKLYTSKMLRNLNVYIYISSSRLIS